MEDSKMFGTSTLQRGFGPDVFSTNSMLQRYPGRPVNSDARSEFDIVTNYFGKKEAICKRCRRTVSNRPQRMRYHLAKCKPIPHLMHPGMKLLPNQAVFPSAVKSSSILSNKSVQKSVAAVVDDEPECADIVSMKEEPSEVESNNESTQPTSVLPVALNKVPEADSRKPDPIADTIHTLLDRFPVHSKNRLESKEQEKSGSQKSSEKDVTEGCSYELPIGLNANSYNSDHSEGIDIPSDSEFADNPSTWSKDVDNDFTNIINCKSLAKNSQDNVNKDTGCNEEHVMDRIHFPDNMVPNQPVFPREEPVPINSFGFHVTRQHYPPMSSMSNGQRSWRPIQSAASQQAPYSKSVESACDNAIANFFFNCNLPAYMADHPAFRDMVSTLRPGYNPNKNRMSSRSMFGIQDSNFMRSHGSHHCCSTFPSLSMANQGSGGLATIGELALQKPAPDFKGTAVVDGDFEEIQLSDFKGKYLVFFFYPLDFTFVCPTEIIAFSDRAAEFREMDCEVIACSTDSHYSHLAWISTPRKQGGLGHMNIPLLSDKNCDIARKYGVYKEDEGVAYRGLFIIDGRGMLRQITINDLPVGRSVDEAIRLVQAFKFTDEHGEVCPAGWKPGDDTMRPDPKNSKKYFEKQ